MWREHIWCASSPYRNRYHNIIHLNTLIIIWSILYSWSKTTKYTAVCIRCIISRALTLLQLFIITRASCVVRVCSAAV